MPTLRVRFFDELDPKIEMNQTHEELVSRLLR